MIPETVIFSTAGTIVTPDGASVAMIALRPLCGDYALVSGGQQSTQTISEKMKFFTNEHYAVSLESRGLAERYHEPPSPAPVAPAPVIEAKQIERYENKMLAPEANKSDQPKSKKPVPARRSRRRRK